MISEPRPERGTEHAGCNDLDAGYCRHLYSERDKGEGAGDKHDERDSTEDD